MRPKAFLPEYSQMPIGDRYRPLFRLFAGENWRIVREGGKPVECDTAAMAREAAKECVKRILNPVIRVEHIEAPVNDALAEEAKAFLSRRDQEAEEERARAFGPDGLSAIILRGGKTVPVEFKRRRA